jgi:hypothetical protein
MIFHAQDRYTSNMVEDFSWSQVSGVVVSGLTPVSEASPPRLSCAPCELWNLLWCSYSSLESYSLESLRVDKPLWKQAVNFIIHPLHRITESQWVTVLIHIRRVGWPSNERGDCFTWGFTMLKNTQVTDMNATEENNIFTCQDYWCISSMI